MTDTSDFRIGQRCTVTIEPDGQGGITVGADFKLGDDVRKLSFTQTLAVVGMTAIHDALTEYRQHYGPTTH